MDPRPPTCITVLGSAVVRASPDIVSIKVSVAQPDLKPANAFLKARQGVQVVQEALRKFHITECVASSVTLFQHNKATSGDTKLAVYTAKASFHIVLRELDRTEEILTAIITAGANEVERVAFESTRISELREEARRLALEDARKKALEYCQAAGAALGGVLRIEEEMNPARLRSGDAQGQQAPQAEGAAAQACDPNAIAAEAAVWVSWQIAPLG